MSHQVGGMLDLPHGVVNGVLLPHVIRFNGAAVPERFVPIAQAMGLPVVAGAPPEEAVERVAERGAPARRRGRRAEGARRPRRDRGRHPAAGAAHARRRLPDDEPAAGVGRARSRRCSGRRCDVGRAAASPRREAAPDPSRSGRAAAAARPVAPTPGPRGAHRPALGQAALLPRAPHLGRAAAPGDRGPGADLGRADAHHRGLRGAGAGRRARPRPSTCPRTGWCSPSPTASSPSRARATSCWARTGRSGPTSMRCPSGSARTCSPWCAGAGRRHGHDAEAHRRHLHVPVRLDGRAVGGFVAWTPPDRRGRRHRPLGAAHPRRPDGRGPAELRPARPLGPAARPHHPPGRRPGHAATPSCRPPRPSWARRGSARCSTPSATGSPASCTTASPSTRCRPGCTSSWPARRSPTSACARTWTPRRTSPAGPSSSCGRRSTRCTTARARRTRTCRRCCAGSPACTCPTSCASRCGSAASRCRCPRSASSRCSGWRARRCSTPRCTPTRAGRWCGWPTAAARSG